MVWELEMIVPNETIACHRIREAAARLANRQALVLRLEAEGNMAAAKVAALRLRDLQLHLSY
jgi:hypothetical protein